MRLSPIPLCATMVVAGSSVWFVMSTVVMDQLPDAALMASALLVALVFISAFAGTPSVERVRSAGTREAVYAALAGVLTWLAPFLLVLTQRATDAPSGTETLFFSTTGWLLAGVLVALVFSAERPGATLVVGSLLAVVGGAILLANWERPSSFSPFMKFPAEESLMLVAGALFALGLVAGFRSVRVMGARSALWIGVASAALVAVVVAIPGGFVTPQTLARIWPQLLLAGAALATLATGLSALVTARGVARSTVWLGLTPVALTGLSAVERLTGAFGPNPIVWLGALGGAIVVTAGVTVVLTSKLRRETRSLPPTAATAVAPAIWPRVAIALAGVATALAIASLFLPAFSATVAGTVESGEAYAASWEFVGAEAAAGWLPFVVALLALAIALDPARQGSHRRRLAAAVCALVAVAAYPLVVATPLHTWTRWIPAEVQQAYGTEYARLTLDVVSHPVRFASVVLTVLTCVTLISIIAAGWRTAPAEQASALKESA